MQQRRFRPGDVLDDYCPRERRLTNHAIVAMIESEIKQTRCVVCDAEHEYKDGKIPSARRKKPSLGLYSQVLDGLQGPQSQPPPPSRPSRDADTHETGSDETETAGRALPVTTASPIVGHAPLAQSGDSNTTARSSAISEEGSVRRTLIRAALPRPEGQPLQQTRSMPEFTVRQPTLGDRQHSHGRSAADPNAGMGRPRSQEFSRGSNAGNGPGHGNGHRQHDGPRHTGQGQPSGGSNGQRSRGRDARGRNDRGPRPR